ncbi:MAG: aromatic acid exporter family protein, partial [Bacillota bacterium]|nr:aromatic acid exporter family protein [Bacillota bacterium]
LQRIGACILALIIAPILFILLGYYPLTFGLFLLIFIPLAARLKVAEGIVVNSVLVTHLLVEKTSTPSLLLNEISLMLIGTSIALILNLYMPSIENKIKEDMASIEALMKAILMNMARSLRENSVLLNEEEGFVRLKSTMDSARSRAYRSLNNYILASSSYYVEYMEMRIQQFHTLNRMRSHFQRFFMTFEQTNMMAEFTEGVAEYFHEKNTAEELLKGLNSLRETYKLMKLPQTREEFENRAMLYQFLNDMEEFLNIKYEFSKRSSKNY